LPTLLGVNSGLSNMVDGDSDDNACTRFFIAGDIRMGRGV
jgi:hypothetical protein